MTTSPGARVEFSGAIATVTIDRPPVNALINRTYDEIAAAFRTIDATPDCRAAIFTGSGTRAFCAGKDLKEAPPEDDNELRRNQDAVMDCFRSIRGCRVPVVASLNGPALGSGLGFAALCDIIVAREGAVMGLPEVNVGTLGGAAFLSQLVPRPLARRMFLLGEAISVEQLAAYGLVTSVVPAPELAATCLAVAVSLTEKNPFVLERAKRSLNDIEQLGVFAGYEVEQQHTAQVLAHRRTMNDGGSNG